MFMKHEQQIIDSVKKISENSWLFGDVVLERKKRAKAMPGEQGEKPAEDVQEEEADSIGPKAEEGQVIFEDGDFCYTVANAPDPLPDATDVEDEGGHVQLVQYFMYEGVAAWRMGEHLLLRAKYHDIPERGRVANEAATLAWLQARDFSFATPHVLHAHERFDRSFTVRTLLPGQLSGRRVVDIWATLRAPEQAELGRQVAELLSSGFIQLKLAEGDFRSFVLRRACARFTLIVKRLGRLLHYGIPRPQSGEIWTRFPRYRDTRGNFSSNLVRHRKSNSNIVQASGYRPIFL